MPLIDALLPEFDREMGQTRKVLDRVPDGQFDWRPHPTSMTLGRGRAPTGFRNGSARPSAVSLDLAAAQPGHQSPASCAAVLAMFDTNVAAARRPHRAERPLMAPWSLKRGRRSSRAQGRCVARVLNHIVHHRGQLACLRRVPLPPSTGPAPTNG
jgi:hypothetical protein